jgi:hypothetical protein
MPGRMARQVLLPGLAVADLVTLGEAAADQDLELGSRRSGNSVRALRHDHGAAGEIKIHGLGNRREIQGVPSPRIRNHVVAPAVHETEGVVSGGARQRVRAGTAQDIFNIDEIRQVHDYRSRRTGIVQRVESAIEVFRDRVAAPDNLLDGFYNRVDSLRDELRQKQEWLAAMMTPEQYQARADRIREHWQRVFSGYETMEQMPWRHRQYLIDQMFNGADEQGRPYGVYVRKIKGKVFDYEIYGRYTEGARFLKGADDDYNGPETESILAECEKEFRAQKAAHRAKEKSIGLEMGGRGVEPLTSCVSSTRSIHLS